MGLLAFKAWAISSATVTLAKVSVEKGKAGVQRKEKKNLAVSSSP